MSDLFLVTTAREEFWDTAKPLLFLGEWCRLYSRRSFWEPLGGKVVASPWKDLADVEATCAYAREVYEELLANLSQALNAIHGTRHETRYWRTVAGVWLLFYLHISLDRFLRIKKALELHPDLTTICCSENSFPVARDTMNYVELCKSDLFNLQIYSRVFSFFGRTFPTAEAAEKPKEVNVSKETLTPRLFVLKGANYLVKKVCKAAAGRPGVMTKSSYFSPEGDLKLFLRSRAKIRPVGRKPVRVSSRPVDNGLREKIASFFAGGDDFRAFIAKTLPLDIPQSFMESFRELTDEAAQYPADPTVIFTSNAYFFDEAFKVWAAACTEKGVPLLGCQHGGNYGITKHLFLLDHEQAICDRYYTWGWEDHRGLAPQGACPPHGRTAEIVPFVAGKLAGRAAIGADNKKEGILLASTASFRYLINFPYLPEYFDEYLDWQMRFASALAQESRSALKVRLLAENVGWDMEERWARFPEVSLEKEGGPNFTESMERCRLFVSDHISTTYMEALSANKPTVMFYNEATYPVRPEAAKAFEGLKRAGILHETPEAAAQTVSAVYADVETWWNELARQAARKDFCHQYGRTSDRAIEEWTEELLSVYERARAQGRGRQAQA